MTAPISKKHFSATIFQQMLMQFRQAVHNAPKKYLIVSDLDGTLLNAQSELSPQTIAVVRTLIDAGHIFCLATGRPWRSSKHVYEKLQLTTQIANLNGSIISAPLDPTIPDLKFAFSVSILQDLVSDHQILELIENIIIEDGSGLHFLHQPTAESIPFLNNWFHLNLYRDKYYVGLTEFFQKFTTLNSILIQINKALDIDKIITIIKSKIKTLTCQLWSLNDETNILEINTIYTNKGNALEYFSSFYGVPMEQTISFGDGFNDVSLVSKAHYGYAMKNAKTTTKFLAAGVTKHDHEHDGVSQKLVEFFLKRHSDATNYSWWVDEK